MVSGVLILKQEEPGRGSHQRKTQAWQLRLQPRGQRRSQCARAGCCGAAQGSESSWEQECVLAPVGWPHGLD